MIWLAGAAAGCDVKKDKATPAAPSNSTPSAASAAPPPSAPPPEALAAARAGSPIDADEQVTVLPALGAWDPASERWKLDVHVWIYEPEESSLRRKLLVDQIHDLLDVEEDEAAREIVTSRLQPFLYDNERGETATVRVGPLLFQLPKTDELGHARVTIALPSAAIGEPATAMGEQGGVIDYEVLTPPSDPRRFAGKAHFVAPTGPLLVSDIDDTVKISEVLDTKALVRRTFLEPFAFVPGTSEAYQRVVRRPGGHLHFLSSSPWQLFGPLSEGLREAGYPPATFSLKRFRPSQLDLRGLLSDPKQSKGAVLEELAKRFPRKSFFLVGDSGEKDPEIYGAFARAHPDLVAHIAIRAVSGEDADAPRFAEAFSDVPTDRWEIYEETGGLFVE